jgi:CRISPR-associated protein Cas2
MEQTRLNAYKIMWLFVFFDLPTNSKKERKAAARFRKTLLQDGFAMMQYSVYMRHCASSESADMHQKRIERSVPSLGLVSIMRITDKQYGNIINFWGKAEEAMPDPPAQLELF